MKNETVLLINDFNGEDEEFDLINYDSTNEFMSVVHELLDGWSGVSLEVREHFKSKDYVICTNSILIPIHNTTGAVHHNVIGATMKEFYLYTPLYECEYKYFLRSKEYINGEKYEGTPTYKFKYALPQGQTGIVKSDEESKTSCCFDTIDNHDEIGYCSECDRKISNLIGTRYDV